MASAVHHQLQARLHSVREIASAVNSNLNLSTVLQSIVDAVCRHTAWSMAGIMVVDHASGYSVLLARHDSDFRAENRAELRWELNSSPALSVVTEHRPIIITKVQESEDFPGYRQDAIDRGYHTVVVLPLAQPDQSGRPMVLSVQSREHLDVTDDEIAFLETVAHQTSIAVRIAQQLEFERENALRFRRTLEMHSRLMNHVLSTESMRSVIQLIESTLSKSLIVIDVTANVVVAGTSPRSDLISDEEWRSLIQGKLRHILLGMIESADIHNFSTSRMIDFSPHGVPCALETLIEPLVVDGQLVGGLFVFSESDGFSDADILTAGEFKFALSVQMLRSFVAFQSEANLQADIMRRLFTGHWRDPEDIIVRAGYLGINLTAPTALMVIASQDVDRPLDHHVTGIERPYFHRWLSQVVSHLWPGSKVIADEGDFVVFIPVNPDSIGMLSRIATRVVEELLKSTGSRPIVTISSVCDRIEDFESVRRRSGQIVAVCRQLQKTGVIREEDIQPYGLLFASVSDDQLFEFVEAMVGKLEVYDLQHGTNLVDTLSVFLRTSCRWKTAAEELGIHVSTLRYRLDRVGQITDADLDDAEVRFGFDLALRLRHIAAQSHT